MSEKMKSRSRFPSEPANAVEAINAILEYAAVSRASDIHIDPRTHDTYIRLRIDGAMETAGFLPKKMHEEIIARLKILSGARTDIHVLPQDGRWQVMINKLPYNMRISFMPTYHGENAVVRLLPAVTNTDISFAKLGFTPDHVRMIDSALRRPHGLVLITGPTGSGKTTTLHACLSLKSREPLSVITLEDPVEYEIPGVRQIHIRHNQGVSFAGGLRSVLRQDPDVIMVGEIRDAETARIAVHTALTGHLVFSTLHTNSALESVSRLVDMGVDKYLLSSTLRLVIAQRLIRNMCHECLANGCNSCRNTGYTGRSLIAEACEFEAGVPKSFKPIHEDGAEKVEWGITTREEVMRALAT